VRHTSEAKLLHRDERLPLLQNAPDLKPNTSLTFDQSPATSASATGGFSEAFTKRVIRKIDRRLLPILFITFILNFINKAALSSASVYGLSSDIVKLYILSLLTIWTLRRSGWPASLESLRRPLCLGIKHILFWVPVLGISYHDFDPDLSCWQVRWRNSCDLGSCRSSDRVMLVIWPVPCCSVFDWCFGGHDFPSCIIYHSNVVYSRWDTKQNGWVSSAQILSSPAPSTSVLEKFWWLTRLTQLTWMNTVKLVKYANEFPNYRSLV